MPIITFMEVDIAIEWHTCKFILNDLDLNYQGQTFQVAILTSIGWKMPTLLFAIRYEVRYLPSNGAAVNVLHCLWPTFQGQEV